MIFDTLIHGLIWLLLTLVHTCIYIPHKEVLVLQSMFMPKLHYVSVQSGYHIARKLRWGIKFGGLADQSANCQIKVRKYILLSHPYYWCALRLCIMKQIGGCGLWASTVLILMQTVDNMSLYRFNAMSI